MLYLLVINTLLLLAIFCQRQVKLSTLRRLEKLMASQEERLQVVVAKLAAIQTGIDTIQQQLEDLKTSNPDLEDEIAAIEANVDALDTDVNPSAPPEMNAIDPPDHQGGGGGPLG